MFSLSSNISFSKLSSINVFYHGIEDLPKKHLTHVLSCKNTAQFEKDIDWLYKNFSSKNTQVQNSIPFQLHFDGGLRSVYETVFPILQKKGIPFQVNVSSDFVDNRDLYYKFKQSLLIDKAENDFHLKKHFQKIRQTNDIKSHFLQLTKNDTKEINILLSMAEIDCQKYLETQQPYLTTHELKEILNAGNSIGISTMSMYAQDESSLFSFLRNELQFQATFHNEEKTLALDTLDFLPGRDLLNKIMNIFNMKIYHIQGLKIDADAKIQNRLSMEMTDASAEEIVRSNFRKYTFQKIFGKNKITA